MVQLIFRTAPDLMKKILVVDDDPDLRKLMRVILEMEGYIVEEAEDGGIALDCVKSNPPDLIISDVIMENVNGFMLHELLREEPATEKIPMILVTGQAQEAGAWDADPNLGYLQKPVMQEDLVEAVKGRLGV